MDSLVDAKTCVVIPNWNGAKSLDDCLTSLLSQTHKSRIIVVDNGSVDNSLEVLAKYADIEIIKNPKNLGFAGGVNTGIRQAIDSGASYIILFNNDATAEKTYIESLVKCATDNSKIGIVAAKILDQTKEHLDSSGEEYSNWGLPFPRGRGETDLSKYDKRIDIFGGSGAASLYKTVMLKEIGLFDEDFFAYYEDVDISFRAQLAGWKVKYAPSAVVYHQIGATSQKIKGFTTYQTMKNLQWLAIKNVPSKYLFGVLIRLRVALILFFVRAVSRGQGWPAFKGSWASLLKLPKKLRERKVIQLSKKVTDEYIWDILVHDLPPNAKALTFLRARWWKLTRRNNANSN